MSRWWQSGVLRSLALVLLCLALYLPGFTSLPPFDRDEARFAQASHQMVESGNYIDIRFQDETRYKKPIGIYWLQSASANLTGAVERIWAYRIPSLLGAIIAVCLAASIAARMYGAVAGLLAGVMLASCLLLGVEARMAKTDAVLLATVLAAQYVLARLWLEKTLSKSLALMFWLAMGFGLLIKGPLILIPVTSVALLLSLQQRSAVWLKPLQPLWGVPLCLAVVAPWLIAISIKSHGQFWRDSVGQDLLAKAAGAQESHGGPPGYYAGSVFITFWPWAALLLPAAWYAFKQRHDARVQFLLAWIVPFWLLFEFFPTKLLHYTLPVFPALATLCAAVLLEKETIPPRLKLAALGLGGVLLVIVAIGVPLAPAYAFPVPMQLSFLSLGAGLLLVAGSFVAFNLRKSKPALSLGIALLVLVNFYAAFWGRQFPGMDEFWVSRSAARLVTPYRADCPGPVTSIGYNEPSLVFYLGKDTQFATDFVAEQARPVNNCRLLLVEQHDLQTDDTTPALGVVRGFNYSRGRQVALYLFRLPASAP